MIEHVSRLLEDSRLVLDTTRGRRAITSLLHDAPAESDRGVELKRTMTEMNKPDRSLQDAMPIGRAVDVALKQKRFLIFKSPVGHLRLVCTSPTRDLIAGKEPRAMDAKDVETFLRTLPPPVANVPMTLVLCSTGGFTIEARGVAERTANRTVILAEPNGAGGWSVYGPPETKALVDLFDPEADNEKRQRIRAEIDGSRTDLLTSGIASDRIAAKTQLPLQLVEAEVKSFAKANPGLSAKRLDGRVVLYREGSAPLSPSSKPEVVSNASSSVSASSAGGLGMPLVDRIRSLFSRKGENEKKVAFLSERRAALSQQRERAYEEISALETKDDELREQFKNARAPLTKKRVTQQLLQLRKDIERRQQMVQVLNQQVNVVSTHLHNLELTQQGQAAQLPDSEEIASDAAAAEEMLAQLQADSELADSVAGTAATAGMSAEEQALYEELEAESGGTSASGTATSAGSPASQSTEQESSPPRAPAKPQADNKRRAEPEAS